MDRLEAMRTFVAVVDAGSLAAAARNLGRSPASVTRAVAQLEASVGERLLERSTRRLTVTETGTRHAAAYRSMLAKLAELEGQPKKLELRGGLVITAPELFGRLHVMPVIRSFLTEHPHVMVRVLLLNRMVDMIGEGVDVAVRLAELPDSSMTAVRIGEVRRLTCAAPSYLVSRAAPERPSELTDHWCIGLNDAGAQELWRYREPTSARRFRSVRVTCRLSVNGAAAAIDAAEHGMGIVRPLSYQVERQIENGALVPLLQAYEPEPIPVHLVLQARRDDGSAVRAFVDHAVPLCRARLASR